MPSLADLAGRDRPDPPLPDERFVSIDSLALDEGRSLARLGFTGAPPFKPDDPCTLDYRALTRVVGDVLQVGVVPSSARGNAICPAVGLHRTLDAPLPAPFAGNVWDDLSGFRHFLGPPDGLVHVTGLPADWLLRAGRDVGGSPTGRWERTWSPDPQPANPARTVVLIEAFDGPAGVTGGDGQGQSVLVGRQPAILYRWPPSGELVVVWTVGTHGVALVAYEQVFPLEDFLRLAETVEPSR